MTAILALRQQLFQGINPVDGTPLRKGAYTSKEYTQYVYIEPESAKKRIFKHKEKIPDELKDRVVPETKVSKSVIGYDNVFSAPKDVSVLWSQVDSVTRERVHALHKEAVKEASTYLEDLCYTRRGRNGFDHQQVDGIFAVFHHTTSRDLDPQLHSHVIMLNTGFDSQGKAGALDGQRILKARYVAGMIYQNHLRGGMEKELGIRTYDRPFSADKGTSFGIEGISGEAKLHFSKRSVAIERRITPTMTGNEIRAEVLKSRQTKQHNIDHARLFFQWKTQGLRKGIRLNKILNQKPHDSTIDREKFLREVSTRLAFKQGETESRRSADERRYLSKAQVVSAILSTSRGKLTTQEVFGLSEDYIEQSTRAIDVRNQRTIEYRDKKGTLVETQVSSQERYYALNERGKSQIEYKDRFEKAQAVVVKAVEWHRQRREEVLTKQYERANRQFTTKMKLLYWTGKISRRQYLQMTEGKGLPESRFMIRTHQALGLISKRQADYLVTKEEREKRFAEIAAWKLEQKEYREWAKGKSEYEKVYRAGLEAKEKREQRAAKRNERETAKNVQPGVSKTIKNYYDNLRQRVDNYTSKTEPKAPINKEQTPKQQPEPNTERRERHR